MNLKRKITKNKNGSLLDIIFWLVVALVFSITILIGFKILTEVDNNIQVMDDIPAASKAVSTRMLGFFPTVIDGGFAFFVIGLVIVTFVLASLVRIHPIFLVFFIISLIFVIFLSGILSNIYTEFAAHPDLIAQADQLILMSYIMRYLPLFTTVFGSVLAIFMYKMFQNSEG